MEAIEIKKGVYWVGVKNPDLRVFDIIMTTEKGTTYNSYLIVDDKVALIDTVKDGFFDAFLRRIKSVIGDRQIDYLVVNHTEPDHSGSIKAILKEYPSIKVFGSKAALLNIKNIVNGEFNGIEAKEDLNIGKRTLKFISAPFLHWPDTIFTYDEHDKMIFTCDFLGSHYCEEDEIFSDKVEDFSKEFKYYYDVIMGPFKKHVLSALDKIKNLEFDTVGTSHGPILRGDLKKYLDLYYEWSKPILNIPKSKYALIAYVSAYGYTRDIAKAFSEGFKDVDCEVDVVDITEIDLEELVAKAEQAKALLVGSPTINQDAVKPVWDFLSLVSPIANRGKIAMAFGSFGWSGEGVQLITDRLKGLKFNVMEPGFKVCFKPSEEDLEKARALGRQIGEEIS
ncbi:Flavo-diiron protein FprA1 [Caloramator mitchellensis]|uniref:Flavo-diiron protein FprA1 n=1 Tax=Caloramator mitchellensis TaxID=908809 RepID=A0A0R3K2N9_CALMK|nr:FprA family A-type flavoprotein [Caloramator mitchellensis]KRQ87253.1 Flavo-diiron protein FprA1 [Caloramator mitchellensis]